MWNGRGIFLQVSDQRLERSRQLATSGIIQEESRIPRHPPLEQRDEPSLGDIIADIIRWDEAQSDVVESRAHHEMKIVGDQRPVHGDLLRSPLLHERPAVQSTVRIAKPNA